MIVWQHLIGFRNWTDKKFRHGDDHSSKGFAAISRVVEGIADFF